MPGSVAQFLLASRKRAAVQLDHRLRAGMQVAGACVVAKAGPELEHILQRGRGKLCDGRKAREEARIVGSDRLHGGLLQHDLGEPDAIRVCAFAFPCAPRQHAAVAVVPAQQIGGIGTAFWGGAFAARLILPI